MKDAMDKADSVYATLQRGGRVAAVSADLDTSADAPALQIAAAGRQRFGQRKPASGGQARATATPLDRNVEKPHPDNPPPGVCNTHYRYGRGAYVCRKKETCPWRNLPTGKKTNT